MLKLNLERFSRKSFREAGFIFAALIILAVGAFTIYRQTFRASGGTTTYYVAPNGSDNNTGDISTPFRTVQKCVNVALAGDTCSLRAGTYAENVVFPRSGAAGAPITVTGYGKEVATVTAADPVTGWTLDHGSVYRAHVGFTLGDTHDQYFVDNKMMLEAQLPNTSPDPAQISHPTRLMAETSTRLSSDSTGSVYRFTDSHLTAPAGTLVNTQIEMSVGLEFTSCGAVVIANAPGSIDFKPDGTSPCGIPNSGFEPRAGDPYAIYPGTSSTVNRLALLDAPGEWVYDPASGNVYAWLPDSSNPSNHVMTSKRRTWVFDTGDQSYITIDLVNTFAGGINMGYNSSHNTLSRLFSQYVDQYRIYQVHFVFYDPDPNHSNYMPSQEFHNGSWHIRGSNHILRDSEIAYAAGNGITLMGSNATVDNVVVHDVAYSTNSYSAVNMRGDGHRLEHSTLYNAAERLIDMTGTHLDIGYNDTSNYMIQFADGGSMYAADIDMLGSRVHHNVIHDCQATMDEPGGLYGCTGIYGDNIFKNAQFDHNLIYNITSTGGIFFGNRDIANISVFNNTVYAGIDPTNVTRLLNWPVGTNIQIKNNTFSAPIDTNYLATATGLTYQNNINGPTNPLFVDPAHGNFQLQASSPAVNAGQNLGEVSNPFAGSLPDIGSLEYSLTPWKYGATVNAPLLARTNFACTNAVVSTNTNCTFDLMNHRKLADNLKLRIGTGGQASGTCAVSGNTVTCTGISAGTTVGTLPVYASTDNLNWENTNSTVSITASSTTTSPHPKTNNGKKPVKGSGLAPTNTTTQVAQAPAPGSGSFFGLPSNLFPNLVGKVTKGGSSTGYVLVGTIVVILALVVIAVITIRRIRKQQLAEQAELFPPHPTLPQK